MEILCGQCGKTLMVDDASAGRVIRCPHCRRRIQVHPPGGPAADQRAAGPDDQDIPGFAEQAKAAMERKIRVVCGNCGRGLIVPARMAGRQTQCPACESAIQIPVQDEETQILERLKLAPETVDQESVFVPEPHTPPDSQAQPEPRKPHKHKPPAAPGESAQPAEIEQAIRKLKSRRLRDAILLAVVIVLAVAALAGVVYLFSHMPPESPPAVEQPSTWPAPTSQPLPGGG